MFGWLFLLFDCAVLIGDLVVSDCVYILVF